MSIPRSTVITLVCLILVVCLSGVASGLQDEVYFCKDDGYCYPYPDSDYEYYIVDEASTPAAWSGTSVTAPSLAPEAVPSHYDRARSLYVQGRLEEAARMFGDLAESAPRHHLAPNALYWLGECYYDRRDLQQAIKEFSKVVKEYPDSPKAPDALLKIVMSYNLLDEGPVAMANLRQLLMRYPKSNAAKMVKTGKINFNRP